MAETDPRPAAVVAREASRPARWCAPGRLGRRFAERLRRSQTEPLVATVASLAAAVEVLRQAIEEGTRGYVAVAMTSGMERYSAPVNHDATVTRAAVEHFLEPGATARLADVADVPTDVGMLFIAQHDEAILDHLRRTGSWEPDEAAAIARVVRPGMTVLDLGAHVGYRTLLLSRLVGPGGRVIAVEAVPENFALLSANLSRHGVTNVLTLPVAVGDESRFADLAISDTNTGDNRLFARAGERSIRVRMEPLGTLLPASARFDFVKSDLQGYDQRALKGMEEVLRRSPPVIVVEFCPRDIRDAGDDAAATLAYYRGLGYHVAVIGADMATASDAEIMAMSAAAEHEYVNLLLTPSNR